MPKPKADKHLLAILSKLALHGASGYWDEVINLIPLAIGAALLLYLYLTSRKRRDKDTRDSKKEE